MASKIWEPEMSEAGYPKQEYSDQPKLDLVWLPCGATLQASAPPESSSFNLPQNDGAMPQRRKGSPLHGLGSASEESSLQKAQQKFWCQQLKLYDQIEDLKPLYAKLWLREVEKEEAEIAGRMQLAGEELEEPGETQESRDSGKEEGEGEEEVEADEGEAEDRDDANDLSDGDVDAHKGTKWQGAAPVDGAPDAAAEFEQRARHSSLPSQALSARDDLLEKLQKILDAKARKPRRTCKVFLVSPLEGENGTLVLPNFSPHDVFEPADVERMQQERDCRPRRCPGPESLRMLKELVAEIKKVEAASESASIYTSGASQTETGATGLGSFQEGPQGLAK